MTNQEIRKGRINEVFKIVWTCNRKGEAVDRNKLISVMGVQTGISRRVVSEYIENLIGANRIIETEEGELWAKEFERYG